MQDIFLIFFFSPELRHETDFSDEKEETFVCFGENDGGEYDQR